MSDRDGGIAARAFLHQKQRERLAHDHTPAKHHHMSACDFDLVLNQQALTAKRRARDVTGGISKHELGDVHWMETIDIFSRIEGPNNGSFIDLLRWRRLNKNAMHCRVPIQFVNAGE